MAKSIPIIDFQRYGLHVADFNSMDVTSLETIGEDLYKTFSTIGFCYITNHGIPQSTIDEVFRISKRFFSRSEVEKQKYARDEGNYCFGWDSIGTESLGTEGDLRDYKEAFNFFRFVNTNKSWSPEMLNFKRVLTEMFDKCTEFTERLFKILAVALKLQDVDFLRQSHDKIGFCGNRTCLRSLHYPELPSSGKFEPGLIRCGEHTDYGTITLLFQDNAGGLEVQNTAGEYVPATPVPGSVVVNIGDLMQRWTSDQLKATRHRVVIPEAEIKKKQSRESIAFFVNPNNDVMISCLDGSDKYEPFQFEDYILNKIKMASQY